MARVLLLIPTATYRAPDFMDAAAKLGIEVVVGSEERQTLQDLFPERSLVVDLHRPERGAEQVARFAERRELDAVVAVDDAGTLVAALASERIGLPHNPFPAVAATRNKHLLRERLAASGVNSPGYRLVSLAEDPSEVAGSLTFPCVLKPLSLSASRGVIRADDPAEFAAAFRRLAALLARPDVAGECGDNADALLVEDYIPGEEVSLEGLLDSGELHVLALFDKPDPLTGPYFEETIYVTPSRLSEERQREVVEAARKAAAALGLRDGPLHAELRLNERGAWPLDIAARSIGGLCSRTLSFGTGMSLEEIILRHAIGADIPSLALRGRASGVMMVPIPAAGTFQGVDGVEEAAAVPGIESVTISMHSGQRVEPLPEGGEYLGFIFARGDEPAGVEAALREAHSRLSIRISEHAPGR